MKIFNNAEKLQVGQLLYNTDISRQRNQQSCTVLCNVKLGWGFLCMRTKNWQKNRMVGEIKWSVINVISLNNYTLRPRWNEQHFADDIFKRIFFDENVWISIKISPKFVPKGPINNIPALVQIMAWRLSGNKPLSEPMMVSLPTHICVTWPKWVNSIKIKKIAMTSHKH